jgi:hypothetical protein
MSDAAKDFLRTVRQWSAALALAQAAFIQSHGVEIPSWLPQVPPLRRAEGKIIHVQSADELFRAGEEVTPGQTISIADGFMRCPDRCEFTPTTLLSAAIPDGAER